ncbi:MAG: hypothetical protein QNJ42_00725 [Crocosphaera sp.]|nr:hypothetical protein [Crocosphaera sp.]
MKFLNKLIVTSITGIVISSISVKTEAANIRGSATFGVPGNVEFGNFVTLTFTADEDITLESFSFDFAGSNAIIDATGFNVTPPDFSDVNAYLNNIINDREFTSNLNGFEPGETVVYTFDFDQASTGTGTPLGRDYVNGNINVTFSDGTNLTAPILETDFLEGTANFYHNNFSGLSFIKPELREIIEYLRENELIILTENEEFVFEFEEFQNAEIAATTPEPVSILGLLLMGGSSLILKGKKSQKS